MKIRRTLPPAASPLTWKDWGGGFRGLFDPGILGRIGREFVEHFGARHAFLVSSGKAALVLILQALREDSSRRKVVVPAYTCYSVPSAVIKAGLDVVPCDIDESTLDFDYGLLAGLVDEETLCVVPTHLFGVPSDVARCREICRRAGAYVVEDAGQAMGARAGGKALGTLGDVGFFSLGRGKNITCLSGGVILTSDDEIAGRIRRRWEGLERESRFTALQAILEAALLIVFLRPRLYWFPAGLPFLGLGETRFVDDFPVRPLGRFHAGLLEGWRSRLESFNSRRAHVAGIYADRLALEGRSPFHPANVPFLRFPLFASDPGTKRDLCERGRRLGMSPMYPDTIANLGPIRRGRRGPVCERAERVAGMLFTLPTHIYVTEKDCVELTGLLRGRLAGEDAGAIHGELSRPERSVHACRERDPQ